jgi:hypothetical protein
MDLTETFSDVNWIELIYDMVQWWSFVIVINIQVL